MERLQNDFNLIECEGLEEKGKEGSGRGIWTSTKEDKCTVEVGKKIVGDKLCN